MKECLYNNTLNSTKHVKVPQNCLSSRPNVLLPSVSQLWSFNTGLKAPQPAGRRCRPQRRAEAKHYLSGAPLQKLLVGPKGPVLRARDGLTSRRKDSKVWRCEDNPLADRSLPRAARGAVRHRARAQRGEQGRPSSAFRPVRSELQGGCEPPARACRVGLESGTSAWV